MKTTRRDFLKNTALLSGSVGITHAVPPLLQQAATDEPLSGERNVYELHQDWKYNPLTRTSGTGEEISIPSFDASRWKPAIVPGTVLTNLLNGGEIPDPFYGMNNEKIPDIYDTGNDYYTYWFLKDFKETASKNEQIWLVFRGINYSADIFLNGKKVNVEPYEGMFIKKIFNITEMLAADGQNRLAVLVRPMPHPGNPNGGQGGDGTIAKNVAHQYPAGWDWIQPVRDRNTGIWDKVFIEKTGPVRITDPHVVTKVPGKRKVNGLQDPVIFRVSACVQNTSFQSISGVLRCQVDNKRMEKKIALSSHSQELVYLPDFTLENPKLWWPAGYGDQSLYDLKLDFLLHGTASDAQTIKTGIREIKTEWNDRTRSMQVLVNGQKIFIRGGNWIISDAMLRFSEDRYEAEIRFHKEMNLNLIRVWGGAITERPEFYNACDQYGLLVMQDFWMSGDANGRWEDAKKKDGQWERRKYPDNHQLFLESAADMIKMLRNHASLAIWCGGNEITPPEDILLPLKDSVLPTLDGTRTFIDYSNSDRMSYNFIGGNGDGPYVIQGISTFWKTRTFPFNSEVGSVGIGDAASLKRFLPEKNWVMPVIVVGNKSIRDPVWTYHKYMSYENSLDPYGGAGTMEEFADKAQLVNYDQYRGLVEGFSSHMWDWYTGFIIWKTQNPWTALRGQMYDCYLDQNACFYGLRSAGKILHAMYSPVDSEVYLVNHAFTDHYNVMLKIEAYDMNGEKRAMNQIFSYIEASSVKRMISAGKFVEGFGREEGLFLDLQLLSSAKVLLDDNFYWLPDSSGNYSGLQKMKLVTLDTSAKKIEKNKVLLTLKNEETNPIAFFNRISLVDTNTGSRILPVFYSDNYLSIKPGETKTIFVESQNELKKNFKIEVKGWNVSRQEVHITG